MIFFKLIFMMKWGLNLSLNDFNYDIKMFVIECLIKWMYFDFLMYDKIKELMGSFKMLMGCWFFL